MPRYYVILEHDHPVLHWDFMLEADETLRAWRLADLPVSGRIIRADSLNDHRREYLEYEGPVSGDRGSVKRWDFGTFDWKVDGPSQIIVNLQGERCRGIANLERVAEVDWRFIFTFV